MAGSTQLSSVLGIVCDECFECYSVKENSNGHVNLKIAQCGNEAMRASKRNSRKDALSYIMTGYSTQMGWGPTVLVLPPENESF